MIYIYIHSYIYYIYRFIYIGTDILVYIYRYNLVSSIPFISSNIINLLVHTQVSHGIPQHFTVLNELGHFFLVPRNCSFMNSALSSTCAVCDYGWTGQRECPSDKWCCTASTGAPVNVLWIMGHTVEC